MTLFALVCNCNGPWHGTAHHVSTLPQVLGDIFLQGQRDTARDWSYCALSRGIACTLPGIFAAGQSLEVASTEISCRNFISTSTSGVRLLCFPLLSKEVVYDPRISVRGWCICSRVHCAERTIRDHTQLKMPRALGHHDHRDPSFNPAARP